LRNGGIRQGGHGVSLERMFHTKRPLFFSQVLLHQQVKADIPPRSAPTEIFNDTSGSPGVKATTEENLAALAGLCGVRVSAPSGEEMYLIPKSQRLF